MRQILLDELRASEVAAIRRFLAENASFSGVSDLYWVELPAELLDPDQIASREDRPFVFAAEVGDSWIKLEFLIRRRADLSSSASRYASRRQAEFILDYASRLIDRLGLQT